jgi:ABC-type transport system substrate-binding protein
MSEKLKPKSRNPGSATLPRAAAARCLLLAAVIAFIALAPCRAVENGPSKPTGILRVARLYDPLTLDPPKVETTDDLLLLPLLHQTLLDLRDGTHLVPGAARAWTMSSDARIYTFRLRPGVRFSNGREVVASDYVFALERLLNPATGCAMSSYFMGVRGAAKFAAGVTNQVDGITAPAPDTLVIELERSDPTFGFLLATQGIALPPEEVARLGPRFGIEPVGDGPYKVREWKRGVRLQLGPNPFYHGAEPQHLEGVDVFVGGDETTHLMMFERGELELANIIGAGIPFPSLRRIRNDPKWRDLIESEDLFGTDFICLNTEVPPLNNVLVRRALNHAINRDKWERVAWGYAAHSEGMIPPIMPGFNPAIKGYDYNPEKARQLLRASGLALPLHTVLWHALDEPARFTAQGVQEDARRVGIEIELKPVNFGQLMSAMAIRRQVPMGVTAWIAALPDGADILGQQFLGRSVTNVFTWNVSFYQNPAVDQLLDEAGPETDLTRRFDLYQQVEKILVEDAPYVFLGHPKRYALRQRWLKGPLLEPFFVYRFDRVWIEK